MFSRHFFSRSAQFAGKNCIQSSVNVSVIRVPTLLKQISLKNGTISRNFTNGVKRLEETEAVAASTTSPLKNAKPVKPVKPAPPTELSTVVTATKIKQGPLKMRFLVRLIRDRWLPDAMAQMKFTPKPRGADILKMLKRASVHLSIKHGTIPEELWVKDVITTKGRYRKTMRIHGRGGVGFGQLKMTRVRITVKVINFDHEISNASSLSQKRRWIERKKLVEKLKGEKKLEVNTATNAAVADN